MSDTLDLFIDLNEAGLDLELEELEAYSQQLVTESKRWTGGRCKTGAIR